MRPSVVVTLNRSTGHVCDRPMGDTSRESVGSGIGQVRLGREERIRSVFPAGGRLPPVPEDRTVPAIAEGEVPSSVVDEGTQQHHVCHERHLIFDGW